MGRYIFKRCLWLLVVLIGVAFVIFSVLYLAPGDPARIMLGEEATLEEIQEMRHILGIDRPYLVQLGDFLYSTFIRFDLGESWFFKAPVLKEVFKRIPITFTISFLSMVLTISVGYPMGISAARNQGKWQDYGVIGVSMILNCLPNFWVALMAVLLFALKLGWLPAQGIDSWKGYILPVVTGALGGIAGNARQARSAMLEVIRADFVTTARAKGQEENVIVRRHMLPNAMMPLITSLGGRLSHIISGSAITERVFSIAGVGTYMLGGISNRDYPVIRATTLFMAMFSAVIVLLTDLAYAWIDPRIKAQYQNSSTRKKGY